MKETRQLLVGNWGGTREADRKGYEGGGSRVNWDQSARLSDLSDT